MIVCIEISQQTKDELDELLKTGGYRGYSEAISVALANQRLLHAKGVENAAMAASPKIAADGQPSVEKQREPLPTRTSEKTEIPGCFSCLPGEQYEVVSAFVPYPDDGFVVGQDVPADQWIFGQHNKLLPAKATCRALARLMAIDARETLALPRIASKIASEAVKLGDYLRQLDATSGVHRDDGLSFAFPYSDDKSRLRYANQFVVSSTKQGALTGLPFELKLINRDHSRNPHILLTEAGWLFATMRNPILDDSRDGRNPKFSGEEIEFLFAHIRSRVPSEAFAYKLVLEAISQGATTPDKLDDALEPYVPKRDVKPFSRAFLTTQRAGVVSRMIDLGLVRRIRDGIKVTYAATGTTFECSPQSLQKVV